MNQALTCHFRQTTTMAVLLLTWCLGQTCARAGISPTALPTGGTVVQGTMAPAPFTTSGSQSNPQLTINQTSGNACINWSSFNVGQNATVNFSQPSASSVTWNNINDTTYSSIYGQINAPGYVVFQNPNGFYVGGTAAITAHGLIMTTATTPAPNLSSGGAWSFNAPPPTASIINYGQIHITGGGSVFLIAADIENRNGIDDQNNNGVGTISAPGGRIGLYAGQQVLVSMSPDGRGLSAEVTLPAGSVDNQGNLIADAGSIAAQAQFVNQGGLIQANSVQNINGVIELVASDSMNLGANSVISAHGDTQGTSSGGSVTIKSDNSFSDQTGSTINISGGTQGGKGGQVEISAPQMSAINSSINGQASAGYADGSFSINTANILLNFDGSPAVGALALNVNSLSSGFSQINLQAANNIEVSSLWNLTPKSGIIGTLSLLAGDTITVDDGAGIEADAGRIAMSAATLNQNGTLQANSIGNVNGAIEIDASDSLNLGASSDIEAHGDNTSASASPGGFVVLKSDNTFSDTAGSKINVAGGTGTGGGQAGVIEIFGKNVVDATSVYSSIGDSYALLINPDNLTLSTSATSTSSSNPNLNLSSLLPYSQICLYNIVLNSQWNLGNASAPVTLNLFAGNDITLNGSLNAGNNWNVNMAAGTLPSSSTPLSGNDGIYLNGSSYIQTQDGNITLFAPNEVIVNSGAIRTLNGGSISVTTEYGNVNTGNNVNGYIFGGSTTPPHYTVNSENLGGISTAAGGNVTITAGGDVISYLPVQSDYVDAQYDGGAGAFGSGNVTITAGRNVYGHYVLADGVGTITAGGNIGAPVSIMANDPTKAFEGFALSLIRGNWSVHAPNGSIYVQDVRNPNGIFNDTQTRGQKDYGYHHFDYDPLSSVLFDAGDSVEITGYDVPHTPPSNPSLSIPILLPPTLQVITGSGDFVLDKSVILFPSPDQNLNLTIGGNFVGIPNGNPINLEMSDSAGSRWTGQQSFGIGDHATAPPELNNPNPVEISVSGNMQDINLYTTKETHLTVGGDVINSGFVGENLHADDVTSIHVTGNIYNSPIYTFAQLTSEITSANPFQPDLWDSIFDLAVAPSALVMVPDPDHPGQQIPLISSFDANHLPAGEKLAYYLKAQYYLLFPTPSGSSDTYGANPGFLYDPASLQLGFQGNMSTRLSASQIAALEGGTITVLVADSHGIPRIDPTTGHLETKTYTFSAAPVIASLDTDSSKATLTQGLGFLIGGPGEFNINANSIDLGYSPGIISYGFGSRYSSLQNLMLETLGYNVGYGGAAINVNANGDLNLITSAIDSIDGGNVNVNVGAEINLSQGNFDFKTVNCYGIYTSGHSDVNVTANGDINIGSGCVATFNGGNVLVESFNGNVNAGNGANKALWIYGIFLDPTTGLPVFRTFGDLSNPDSLQADPAPYGSGILAESLTEKYQTGGISQPGNITVETPNGNIVSTLGGISQFALNGSIAGGPTINLTAGMSDTDATPDQGNISLGQGGVVGGTINITPGKGGSVQGLIVASKDVNINTSGSSDVTVLAGGTANFFGGGNVSGTVVGIGGINVAGGASVTATLLSQNVSTGGGAESTLATSANATSTSQSAAQQANSDAKQQVASSDTGDDDQKKKKKASAIQHIKRVTVLLSKA
jgi:filamentous hemagglutinin family protein